MDKEEQVDALAAVYKVEGDVEAKNGKNNIHYVNNNNNSSSSSAVHQEVTHYNDYCYLVFK